MIYVLDSDFKYNITSKILDFYNIKYKAVEASGQDLINILMEDNFSAIFLTYEYKDILNEYYNKDIKKFLAVDLITKNKDHSINFYNTLDNGFIEFSNRENIVYDDKRILILGSSLLSQIIYKAIKKISNPTVFISSITEEKNNNLYAGDRKIKKVEIQNLVTADIIINTTELGNINNMNSIMINSNNEIIAKEIIETITIPAITNLIRRYKLKGARVHSGLLLYIYQIAFSLSKIFENDSYYNQVYDVYNKLVEEEEKYYEC